MATSVKTEAETDMPCTRPLILHMVLSKGHPASTEEALGVVGWPTSPRHPLPHHHPEDEHIRLSRVHQQLPLDVPIHRAMLNPGPKQGICIFRLLFIQRWPLAVQILKKNMF